MSVGLSLRRAEPSDIAAAQAAYRQIVDYLAETVNYPGWYHDSHPTPLHVESWVERGDLYLAVDEETVAGAVVLDHRAPDAYDDAAWAVDARGEEVLVVHALGVRPDFLRRGVARFLVDSLLDVARAKGCRAVRLDTYVENSPARELYTRHGFTNLGLHTVHYEGTDLDQFHLFEYVL